MSIVTTFKKASSVLALAGLVMSGSVKTSSASENDVKSNSSLRSTFSLRHSKAVPVPLVHPKEAHIAWLTNLSTNISNGFDAFLSTDKKELVVPLENGKVNKIPRASAEKIYVALKELLNKEIISVKGNNPSLRVTWDTSSITVKAFDFFSPRLCKDFIEKRVSYDKNLEDYDKQMAAYDAIVKHEAEKDLASKKLERIIRGVDTDVVSFTPIKASNTLAKDIQGVYLLTLKDGLPIKEAREKFAEMFPGGFIGLDSPFNYSDGLIGLAKTVRDSGFKTGMSIAEGSFNANTMNLYRRRGNDAFLDTVGTAKIYDDVSSRPYSVADKVFWVDAKRKEPGTDYDKQPLVINFANKENTEGNPYWPLSYLFDPSQLVTTFVVTVKNLGDFSQKDFASIILSSDNSPK